MNMQTHTIPLASSAPIQLMDITDDLTALVQQLKLQDGLVVVASQHTTAAVRINEKCDNLEKDFLELVGHWIDPNKSYHHNHSAVDGRANAHSHLLSFFMASSETILIKQGQLQLGTWQRLFFVELDGPREARQVQCSFISTS